MNPQVRRYIESAPEAISGSGGHLTTLRVARCLYNGFGLDRQEVIERLRVYNSRLSDKWTDRELEHKADSAVGGTYDKPRGWMLGNEQLGPREICVTPAQYGTEGAKRVEKTPNFRRKYILATVATLKSQSPRHIGARAESFQESERRVASVAGVCPTHQESERTVATVAELGEAKRVAGELAKAHRDGAISGNDDPEAGFYAQVIHTFGGTYIPKLLKEKEDTSGPYVPTKEQRVIVPPGLSAKERQQFLQDDLDRAIE